MLGFDNDALVCPGCGGNNLHQFSVRARARSKEDGPGVIVSVRGYDRDDPTVAHDAEFPFVVVAQKKDASLPHRRDSLSVMFWCETCPALPVLWIYQHKGSTLVEWADAE